MYLPMVNTHAIERGNSSDVPSRRGGTTSVPRGSVDRRAHPPKDVEEEETRSQMGLQSLYDSVNRLERVTYELRHDLEYYQDRHLYLQDLVNSSRRNGRRTKLGLRSPSLRMSGHSVRFATS